MSLPVPLRADFNTPHLRRLARDSKDANQARRLLALATIYAGGSRRQAAEVGGVGLQIVRDWVIRFNAEGPIHWTKSTSRQRTTPWTAGIGPSSTIRARARRCEYSPMLKSTSR